MTDQSRLQLTDATIERMLVERAGPGAPADLVPSIIAAVASSRQRAPGLVGALSRPGASQARRGPRRTWLLVAATLLVGAGVVGASVVGGRLVRPTPTLPVVVANPTAVPNATSTPSPTPTDTPAVVPYEKPSLTATGGMATRRMKGTATLLADGRVLVAGGSVVVGAMETAAVASADLYDPGARTWIATGTMLTTRTAHTATLLPDGRVLVAGGSNAGGSLTSAELYDPSTGSWTATGSMGTPHSGHTATLLSDGRVLVAGGQASFGGRPSAVAELYDPSSGTWTVAGGMIAARMDHTATLLPDGRVLVAGGGENPPESPAMISAELYDPSTGSWTATGSMGTPHRDHTATLLSDGRVLVAGGYPSSVKFTFPSPPTASAELYDPSTGSWTVTGDMDTPRTEHTATRLSDGRVLVAGGVSDIRDEESVTGVTATTAEIYDPGVGSWTASGTTTGSGYTALLLADGRVLFAGSGDAAYLFDPGSGTPPASIASTPKPSHPPWVAPSPSPVPSGPPGSGWTLTGGMTTLRSQQSATLLRDGTVLVVGGAETPATELYDPVARTWTTTGSMSTPRTGHTATLLRDGRVLVAGGYATNDDFASAELYDPASGTWTATGRLHAGRRYHTATLLPDGRVLVAGGAGNSVNLDYLASAELYDPGTGTWSRTGRMTLARMYHKATLLLDGKVLVTGGINDGPEGGPTVADVYDPSSGTWAATRKMVSPGQGDSATLLPDGRVLVAGGANGTSAQLYDPGTGTWSKTGSMLTHRRNHTATLLADGTVLVTGGEYQPTQAEMIASLLGETTPKLASAELYQPASGSWTATSSLLTSRNINDTATLLADGTVLLAGGNDHDMGNLASAELYEPGSR